MRVAGRKISPFLVSVAAAIAATAIILTVTLSCSANKLTFKTTFYLICYRTEDNAVSAGSISGVVSSYGGAGYILEYNDKFFITVSCYYNEKSAKSICENLKKRDLDCEVIKITTEEYAVASASNANNDLYKGNLDTLNSLTTLAYGCANSIDTGEFGQTQAKNVIDNIKSTLRGLLQSNSNNCFTSHLKKLITECDDAAEGYIYSKDLRRLQIAIADTIINIKLY